MLLDEVLPSWHFSSGRHAVTIEASPEAVEAAIAALRPTDIPLLRELFWLRTLPARLTGREAGYFLYDDTPMLDQAARLLGFVTLAEQPRQELVFGAVGRWWLPLGAEFWPLEDREAFTAFDLPGYAKTAANLRLEGGGRPGTTRLTHETRTYATDPAARRRFGRYWTLILPGVVLLRKMWLRALKRKAERAAGGAPKRDAPIP